MKYDANWKYEQVWMVVDHCYSTGGVVMKHQDKFIQTARIEGLDKIFYTCTNCGASWSK